MLLFYYKLGIICHIYQTYITSLSWQLKLILINCRKWIVGRPSVHCLLISISPSINMEQPHIQRASDLFFSQCIKVVRFHLCNNSSVEWTSRYVQLLHHLCGWCKQLLSLPIYFCWVLLALGTPINLYHQLLKFSTSSSSTLKKK